MDIDRQIKHQRDSSVAGGNSVARDDPMQAARMPPTPPKAVAADWQHTGAAAAADWQAAHWQQQEQAAEQTAHWQQQEQAAGQAAGQDAHWQQDKLPGFRRLRSDRSCWAGRGESACPGPHRRNHWPPQPTPEHENVDFSISRALVC